ncbi:hypothetical protein [Allochromatium vinosum]|uniref:TubC N-terminal docking domain-related protein n=1 Tax=Allochromatium vinosum TaxID=1049 RepID=UPI001906F79E
MTQNGNPGPSAPPPATPEIRHSQRRTIQINESGGTGEPSAAEILHTLADQGFTLAVEGDRLTVSPSSRLTEPMRAEIRQHKAELVALLAANDAAVSDPPPLTRAERQGIVDAIVERAAILEFDAGMERRQAETQAISAMRVFRALVAMPNGQPPRWLILLAPGCDLAEARQTLAHQFGAERVMEVVEHGAMEAGR